MNDPNQLRLDIDVPEVRPPRQFRARAYAFGRRIAPTALLATAAMAAGAWTLINDSSGEYVSKYPTEDPGAIVDGEMRMGSWNMHGEAASRVGQIALLAKTSRLDALALQEVTGNDVEALHDYMPGWHIRYVVADKKQHPLQGGYGNALLTKQRPRDVKTRVFEGTSFVQTTTRTVAGAMKDAVSINKSLKRTRDGMQENRAAIAETIDFNYYGTKIPVRIITAHIAGPVDWGVHARQTGQFLQFLQDNIKEGRPAVMCGDLNADEAEVFPEMVDKRYIMLPDSANTSLNGSGRKIDHCAYFAADKLAGGRVSVIGRLATDHHPIVSRLRAKIQYVQQ